MTSATQRIGAQGEALAARYLESKGYRIVCRGYRTRRGEIDIVASRGRLVVFVEVKTRRGGSFGAPAESVHLPKQARMARAAAAFLAASTGRRGVEPECRFDVISIRWMPQGDHAVEHIEDAFRPGGEV